MLLFYLVMIYTKKEEIGYIFSEGKQRFLTINGVDIVTTKRGEKPAKFRMEKMDGGNSSNVLIRPVLEMETKKVADYALNSSRKWHLYPEHRYWNQRVRLVLMPGNVLKIAVDSICIAINGEGKAVGETCKSEGDDKYQLFSWVPKSQKRKVKAWTRWNMHAPAERDNEESDGNEEVPPGHDQDWTPNSSGYDSDTSSEDYHRRGRKPFYDSDGRGGLGGYGPFNTGMGFFGSGRRKRYRRDEDLKYIEDGDDETHKNDRDYHEGRMFRRKRMGGHLRGGRIRRHRYYGTGERDGNFYHGRGHPSKETNGPDPADYMDGLQGNGIGGDSLSVSCNDGYLYEEIGNPQASLFGGVVGEDSGHCNTGSPGENEICRINKTGMAFRKMVGIPI
ncbi:hypothetical protein M970_081510 [Encephalitozoon cuniculi EcunIII-L]|nr:hypothetical protein M970_081510 [Encephalitozoon cuniculi EcunIII-L]